MRLKIICLPSHKWSISVIPRPSTLWNNCRRGDRKIVRARGQGGRSEVKECSSVFWTREEPLLSRTHTRRLSSSARDQGS